MPPRKTFVLGLGAQKCGTTWLYNYLNDAPDCDMGAMKEYHIWDGKLVPEFAFFRVGAADILRARSGPVRFSRRQQIRRLVMQRRAGAYERYFSRLARGPITLTGDITPSYSALRAPALAEIRERLERAGFAVKVVFLMRDPVERCWSSVRMTRRNDGIGNLASKTEAAHLAKVYASPIFELRTNYHQTIAAIDEVFDAGDVYFGLFEEMFTEPELRRLSGFFERQVNLALIAKSVNVSPKSVELEADLIRAIRAHYAPVYAFCAERFPRTAKFWLAG